MTGPPYVAERFSAVYVSSIGPYDTMRSLTQQRQSHAHEALTRSCVASSTILPGFALLLDDFQDHLLRARVDAVHRLIEQQHVGLLRERAGDEHSLLLSAGELADLRVPRFEHADALEHAPRRPRGRGGRGGGASRRCG